MANELRVRVNGIGGKVEDNPLTAATTTLTSAGLGAVPAIGTTQHLAVVLDPDGIDGAPEIVWITAHTVNASTATILRAQEGTTARQHLRDTDWIHGPTIQDFGSNAWTPYTPVWTAVTTNPVIGNGTLAGAYFLLGRTCFLRLNMQAGSTTTFGSGAWIFSLPTNVVGAAEQYITAYAEKNGARYSGTGYVQGDKVIRTVFTAGTDGASSTNPFTWAANDAFRVSGSFEVNG